MMEYIIVSEISNDTLVSSVNFKIKDGWRPIGGVCFTWQKDWPVPGQDGAIFMQSMVRSGKGDKEYQIYYQE